MQLDLSRLIRLPTPQQLGNLLQPAIYEYLRVLPQLAQKRQQAADPQREEYRVRREEYTRDQAGTLARPQKHKDQDAHHGQVECLVSEEASAETLVYVFNDKLDAAVVVCCFFHLHFLLGAGLGGVSFFNVFGDCCDVERVVLWFFTAAHCSAFHGNRVQV